METRAYNKRRRASKELSPGAVYLVVCIQCIDNDEHGYDFDKTTICAYLDPELAIKQALFMNLINNVDEDAYCDEDVEREPCGWPELEALLAIEDRSKLDKDALYRLLTEGPEGPAPPASYSFEKHNKLIQQAVAEHCQSSCEYYVVHEVELWRSVGFTIQPDSSATLLCTSIQR